MNKIEFAQDMFEAMSHEIKQLKTKAIAYELRNLDAMEALKELCCDKIDSCKGKCNHQEQSPCQYYPVWRALSPSSKKSDR